MLDYKKIHEEFYIKKNYSLEKISKLLGITRRNLTKNFKDLGLEIKDYKINYSDINIKAFDVWNLEMAYWLGFIAADGSIHRNKNAFTMFLKIEDINHLIKLKKFLNLPDECLSIRKTNYKVYKECAVIYFSNNHIIDRLKNLGILPDKSHKYIDYFSIVPNDYILPFLLGYFDGDGSLKVYRNNIHITFLGNKKFITDIKNFFVNNYGFNDNLITDYKGIYGITWARSKDVKIFYDKYLNVLGKDIPLNRKLNLLLDYYDDKKTRNENKINKHEINKHKINKKEYYCNNCGIIITNNKSNLCSKCVRETLRKVERPSREKLMNLIENNSYESIGRMYNVSGKAIRKWVDYYNLR